MRGGEHVLGGDEDASAARRDEVDKKLIKPRRVDIAAAATMLGTRTALDATAAVTKQ